MKNYEDVYRYRLPPNQITLLRADGRSFHTWGRGLEKPFDESFIDYMDRIGLALCKDLMNVRMAYLQSDEISVIMVRGQESSQDWFGGNIQKIVSIAASIATAAASRPGYMHQAIAGTPNFDARVFVLPSLDETVNALIWRQRDWERNSIQMLARSLYGQKEMENKKREDLHEMIHAKGKNWNDLPVHLRRGRCIVKVPEPFKTPDGQDIIRHVWRVDMDIPIFTQDRDYILRKLAPNEPSGEKA